MAGVIREAFPAASIFAVRVFGAADATFPSLVARGILRAAAEQCAYVNLSLSVAPGPGDETLRAACAAAIEAGCVRGPRRGRTGPAGYPPRCKASMRLPRTTRCHSARFATTARCSSPPRAGRGTWARCRARRTCGGPRSLARGGSFTWRGRAATDSANRSRSPWDEGASELRIPERLPPLGHRPRERLRFRSRDRLAAFVTACRSSGRTSGSRTRRRRARARPRDCGRSSARPQKREPERIQKILVAGVLQFVPGPQDEEHHVAAADEAAS